MGIHGKGLKGKQDGTSNKNDSAEWERGGGEVFYSVLSSKCVTQDNVSYFNSVQTKLFPS